MTSQEFATHYRLLNQIRHEEAVRTHLASAIGGAVVMVHFLEGERAMMGDLREMVRRLPPEQARRVLFHDEVDGVGTIVTKFILDFVSFPAWLRLAGGGAATMRAPAAAPGSPAEPVIPRLSAEGDPPGGAPTVPSAPAPPLPPPAAPAEGEFTRMFRLGGAGAGWDEEPGAGEGGAGEGGAGDAPSIELADPTPAESRTPAHVALDPEPAAAVEPLAPAPVPSAPAASSPPPAAPAEGEFTRMFRLGDVGAGGDGEPGVREGGAGEAPAVERSGPAPADGHPPPRGLAEAAVPGAPPPVEAPPVPAPAVPPSPPPTAPAEGEFTRMFRAAGSGPAAPEAANSVPADAPSAAHAPVRDGSDAARHATPEVPAPSAPIVAGPASPPPHAPSSPTAPAEGEFTRMFRASSPSTPTGGEPPVAPGDTGGAPPLRSPEPPPAAPFAPAAPPEQAAPPTAAGGEFTRMFQALSGGESEPRRPVSAQPSAPPADRMSYSPPSPSPSPGLGSQQSDPDAYLRRLVTEQPSEPGAPPPAPVSPAAPVADLFPPIPSQMGGSAPAPPPPQQPGAFTRIIAAQRPPPVAAPKLPPPPSTPTPASLGMPNPNLQAHLPPVVKRGVRLPVAIGLGGSLFAALVLVIYLIVKSVVVPAATDPSAEPAGGEDAAFVTTAPAWQT